MYCTNSTKISANGETAMLSKASVWWVSGMGGLVGDVFAWVWWVGFRVCGGLGGMGVG